MAINSNHISEDLEGIKCVIVEKNVSPERVAFLKPLLEYNYLTVVVVPSPPAKVAAAAAPSTDEGAPPPPPAPPAPETFTVGVTNMLFNVTNAVYGRLLRTPDGHVVTAAYWQQKESVSHDEVPYYERK
ncbi:MAG: hypothetical protein B7Y15_06785 [Bacteroidetes bacterium 24-39-8]|jgi:hypothetical protein|nr:MAG: hypothetical protein B7Y15_06785 [Bacteroidetes bacterium 24-39-8]OZA66899.1 MAG: hypothetical protein B7X72_04745 [Sphingobacteriia bacterium 39-39-8]HQR93886.1 hypothetical protein [Sediminibacterium sp.]HQS54698.1 hypothetical protein [Sediminibacterium sp.]